MASDLKEAARQMQISARLMADSATASLSAPEPVVAVVATTAASEPVAAPAPAGESSEPVVVVQPGAAPDINISVENTQAATVEDNDETAAKAAPGGPDPEEPRGVKLLGISSEVWTQLLVALGLLATAVAGYLGRERIPGVKEITKKGKAARAEKRSEKSNG